MKLYFNYDEINATRRCTIVHVNRFAVLSLRFSPVAGRRFSRIQNASSVSPDDFNDPSKRRYALAPIEIRVFLSLCRE